MKSRDLLSILLHRPGVRCRALVDPLLPDGDGLELESAGRRRSGKTRKGSKWLRSALTGAAHAAARS
jgi:hypothetical protein